MTRSEPERANDVYSIYERAQDPRHDIWLQGPAPSPTRVGVLGFRYGPYNQQTPQAIDQYAVVLYVAGETRIQRTVGERVEAYEVGPGDISLEPACVATLWSWQSPIDVLHIYLDASYMRELAHEATGKPCRLHMRHGLRLCDETLLELGVQLVHELHAPRIGTQRGVQALGDCIALHLLRTYFDIEHDVRDPTLSPAQVAQLRAFIEDHLADDLQGERLASLLHLSVAYFSRTFRASFGQSPHDYVREVRLARAHDLLLTSDVPVSSIAIATGFADQSHLTRCFKQRFGVPPGVLRRERRSEACEVGTSMGWRQDLPNVAGSVDAIMRAVPLIKTRKPRDAFEGIKSILGSGAGPWHDVRSRT